MREENLFKINEEIFLNMFFYIFGIFSIQYWFTEFRSSKMNTINYGHKIKM